MNSKTSYCLDVNNTERDLQIQNNLYQNSKWDNDRNKTIGFGTAEWWEVKANLYVTMERDHLKKEVS